MLRKTIFLILILNNLIFAEESAIKWINVLDLGISGQGWKTEKLEHPYDRLPYCAKDTVREPVWKLSQSSAGLNIRFKTNSEQIKVRWHLRNNNHMPHMADTGTKGVDLYIKKDDNYHFVRSGKPYEKINEATLISKMDSLEKECIIYLPLYDGIDTLFIGVTANATISSNKEELKNKKPILFYGTSITQGGCASRPGMAFPSIIGRKLNSETINLGFSGNGRMEIELAELIREIDASCYVIDCLPNITPEQVTERTIPFINTLRKFQPTKPIILVETPIYDYALFNQIERAKLELQNVNLKKAYNELINSGDKNIFYVNGDDLIGTDNEATVDGVHYTDLGFMRYSEKLCKVISGILK